MALGGWRIGFARMPGELGGRAGAGVARAGQRSVVERAAPMQHVAPMS